jgi:hypothetical protein
MSPDHNAIIGEAPAVSRFLYATGFSGHGFLHAPAVGELVRDLVLRRRSFVDASAMGVERFDESSSLAPEFTSGYSGEGDTPTEQLELLPGAVDKADAFLTDHRATRERFERVASLVDGFETPYGLELLATAHWVATKEGARTPDAIHEWAPGKRQFSRPQIALAVERLADGAWVDAR